MPGTPDMPKIGNMRGPRLRGRVVSCLGMFHVRQQYDHPLRHREPNRICLRIVDQSSALGERFKVLPAVLSEYRIP